MTFSGSFDPGELITFLRGLLKAYGFTMNDKKTKVLYQHHRQIVTGAVVNKKPQPSKEYRRKIRQEIYYIRRYGYLDHLDRRNGEEYPTPLHYLDAINGKINYLLQYSPDDEELLKWKYEIEEIGNSIF